MYVGLRLQSKCRIAIKTANVLIWPPSCLQVRYDRHLSAATAVKFMTDGILLRELQEDFLLCQYSVLIIDEAHERSLNTDLLLGTCSALCAAREGTCPRKIPYSTLSPGLSLFQACGLSTNLLLWGALEKIESTSQGICP